jgi:hypothetical protein
MLPFFSQSTSRTNAALIAALEGATYKNIGSDGEGGESIAIFSMYTLSLAKALLCSGPHSILPLPFNALKNGRLCSADLEMNLLRAATRPFNIWMTFFVFGCSIYLIPLILSGLASILLQRPGIPISFLS